MNIGWRFPRLDHGSKQGFTNSGVETFRGEKLIENLAREICQNSLDAKSKIVNDPVHVVFELEHLNRQDPVFDGMQKHIELCERYWDKGADSKLKTFLKQSKNVLSKDKINAFIARDFNTTGLNGVFNSKESPWLALVQSTGYSVKDEGSAGSYGIGKNAPFACSALSTVFYNTLAEDGGEAFQGVFKLATHEINGEETQGEGYYCIFDTVPRPIYPSDNCSLRDQLKIKREKTGTDIIILGFDASFNWMDELIIAIIKNFFIAIHEKKLIVSIGNDTIDSDSLFSYLVSPRFKNSKDMKETREYYETFTHPNFRYETKILKESSESFDIELFINENPEFSKGIAKFRQTGMLIRVNKKRTVQHFAAVLIVRGQRLGNILRDSEPPAHDDWDSERVVDPRTKRDARHAIYNIDRWLKEIFSELFERNFEESLDSGMGEYLPADSNESIHNTIEDTDIMNIAPQIIDAISISPPKNKTTGDKSIGKPLSGNVNADSDRSKIQKRPLPPPVKPDKGNISGVSPDTGDKKITYPQIKGQRVFSPDAGTYNIYLKSEDFHSNIYISLESIGEDGFSEDVNIISCSDDIMNLPYPFKGSKLGPINLDANVPKNIKIEIDTDEKLCLKLSVTEEQI
ncbi:MAG: hypothetical protein RBQ94_01270 [Methanimicrococcus sp.]|nr:hypothetical protein [Methanimicrococcus sp.]